MVSKLYIGICNSIIKTTHYCCYSYHYNKHNVVKWLSTQFWNLIEKPPTYYIFTIFQAKEIGPECSLEGMMLKLKLQHFDHLMRSVDSLEKTWMLGGLGSGREGDERMRWMDSITDLMDIESE